MSLFRVFEVSGSALTAQSVRLNLVASNLANVETAARTPEEAYKARHPVFEAVLKDQLDKQKSLGVTVSDIITSDAPARRVYEPEHPMANEEGYIFMPNVNSVEEMTNMMSASRSFQMNVQVMDSVKELLAKTLRLGE